MNAGAGRGGTDLPDTPSVYEMLLWQEFPGLYKIINERRRQVKEEGWTPKHDAEHVDGELSQAAAYYCMPDDCHDTDLMFPEAWASEWMKREGFPQPSIRDLVKAGALIAAEIDRRLRAEESPEAQQANRR